MSMERTCQAHQFEAPVGIFQINNFDTKPHYSFNIERNQDTPNKRWRNYKDLRKSQVGSVSEDFTNANPRKF